MSNASKIFLTSFNRIEKWLQLADGGVTKAGFSQLVRHLSADHSLAVEQYEEDLLQFSQLRNAIVHDQIKEDFVIAEPNEWAVNRIQLIERALYEPELVVPKFARKVSTFSTDLSAFELLEIVAKENYSQFPLYEATTFKGLLTLKDLGLWFAHHPHINQERLAGLTAADLLENSKHNTNYQFVSERATIIYVQELFKRKATLETILVTKDGNSDSRLTGIIRPRDVLDSESE